MSEVKVSIFHAGYCQNIEHLAIQGGRWKNIRFPAMFALIEHPGFGPMLFDTGYSFRFFEETRRLPNSLYARMTPVTLREDELAVSQLSERGIRPHDVERVFISHFHADHVAALGDFPAAKYVYMPHAYGPVRDKHGFGALRHGVIPGLFPADFEEQSETVALSNLRKLPKEFRPFTHGVDLLGDGSIMAVELPGHATGQMGLILRAADGGVYFLVGDACWLRGAFEEARLPHPIANLLFSDPEAYKETVFDLAELHQKRPDIRIIPSHCAETISKYSGQPI